MGDELPDKEWALRVPLDTVMELSADRDLLRKVRNLAIKWRDSRPAKSGDFASQYMRELCRLLGELEPKK